MFLFNFMFHGMLKISSPHELWFQFVYSLHKYIVKIFKQHEFDSVSDGLFVSINIFGRCVCNEFLIIIAMWIRIVAAFDSNGSEFGWKVHVCGKTVYPTTYAILQLRASIILRQIELGAENQIQSEFSHQSLKRKCSIRKGMCCICMTLKKNTIQPRHRQHHRYNKIHKISMHVENARGNQISGKIRESSLADNNMENVCVHVKVICFKINFHKALVRCHQQ